MARLVNGSTRDIAYTITEMYFLYVTNIAEQEIYEIDQEIRYYGESIDDQDVGEALNDKWGRAQRARQILQSPEWKNLMDTFALRLEYWMLKLQPIKNLNDLGPSDACEKWAKSLLKIAIMKDLHNATQYEMQSFLDAGNVKHVAGIGAYIAHHAPPPQIEGPRPMNLLELVDSYDKVYQESYAPVLPTSEAIKQLAPGGLFD